MYTYIKKDIRRNYINSPVPVETVDGYATQVGTTWDDYLSGKFLQLSDEQIGFHINNPELSVEDVWLMRFPVTAPDTLDDIKQELHNQVDQFADSLRMFYVNGESVWFEDRPSLKLQADAATAYNADTVMLYDSNGNSYNFPADAAADAILAVEHYNTQCIDFVNQLHAQIETIPSIEYAERIEVSDFTGDAPVPPRFGVEPAPDIPDSSADVPLEHTIIYKVANCYNDAYIVSVADGDPFKVTIYPDMDHAIRRTDMMCEMNGVKQDITFGPDLLGREEYAQNAYIYIPSVTGDVLIAGIAIEYGN